MKHSDKKKSDQKIHTQFSVQNYFNTSILYTTDKHFYNPSVKIGFISFISSSDTKKFHHLLGYHATGINSSFNYFFKCFAFSNLIINMNNSTRIIFIEVIIKIKIHIKSTHFITRKYNITRNFIKVEYIFICVQISKKSLIVLLVTNESGKSFNAAGESSTTS